MTFTWIRLASIGAVVALRALLPEPAYLSLFFAIVFAHYTLATIAARRQIPAVLHARRAWLPLLVLTAVTAAVTSTFTPALVWPFALHNAFSDAYTDLRPPPAVTTARALLGIAAYLFLFDLLVIAPVLLALAAAGFVLVVIVKREQIEDGTLWDVVSFEVVGVVAVLTLSRHAPALQDVIFYHLLFWVFFPLTLRRGAPAAGGRFAATFAALTLVLLCFTPLIGVPRALALGQWHWAALVAAYIHIALTFALSPANPMWVRRLFGSVVTSP